MDSFHEFTEQMYTPSSDFYKPFNVLKSINAYSDCNAPIAEDYHTFSQLAACSGCVSQDRWVVKPADCPAGYTYYTGSNTGKTCLGKMNII